MCLHNYLLVVDIQHELFSSWSQWRTFLISNICACGAVCSTQRYTLGWPQQALHPLQTVRGERLSAARLQKPMSVLQKRLAGWKQATAEPQKLPSQFHAEPGRWGNRAKHLLSIIIWWSWILVWKESIPVHQNTGVSFLLVLVIFKNTI